MAGWWPRRARLEQPHEHELVAPVATEPVSTGLAPWEVELVAALELLDELAGHLRNIERDRTGASISTLVNKVLDVRWRVQRAMNRGTK